MVAGFINYLHAPRIPVRNHDADERVDRDGTHLVGTHGTVKPIGYRLARHVDLILLLRANMRPPGEARQRWGDI